MVPAAKLSSIVENYAPIWVCCSLVFFFIANYVLYKITPVSASKSKFSGWKWRNSATSLLHAFITGVGSLICLYLEPKLATDFVDQHTLPGYILISTCIGYFIYDLIDMLLNDMGRTTMELLGHHTFVVLSFSVPLINYKYAGVAVCGILVEVNSVFLHFRELLQIQGVRREAATYFINSLVNAATFVVFRLVVLTFITAWIQLNKYHLPFSLYAIGLSSLFVVTGMNYVLFYRVIQSDFLVPSKLDGANNQDKASLKANKIN